MNRLTGQMQFLTVANPQQPVTIQTQLGKDILPRGTKVSIPVAHNRQREYVFQPTDANTAGGTRMTIKGFGTMAVCAALTLGTAAFAQTATPQSTTSDIQKDKKDIRHDKRDINKDRKERNQDLRDAKKELKEGDKKEAKEEMKEAKAEQKDINKDKKDLRKDKHDLRHDRRERRKAATPQS